MDVPKSFSEAMRLVIAAESRTGEVGAFARQMLELMQIAEREIRAHPIDQPNIRVGAKRHGEGEIQYVVEESSSGETLAERRLSGKSQPFRCPHRIYDALVSVLASAERPLSADEIASLVEARLGERPAEFQLRVPLRLWMHSKPLLVTRNRARYGLASPKDFRKHAEGLWGELRQ